MNSFNNMEIKQNKKKYEEKVNPNQYIKKKNRAVKMNFAKNSRKSLREFQS